MHLLETFKRYFPWFLLLLAADIFSSLVLWLSDISAFQVLSALIILWTIVFLGVVLVFVSFREKKKEKLFHNFITNPNLINEEKLLDSVSRQEERSLKELAEVLREKQMKVRSLTESLMDYEEYVEGWAHEAKTPLSLFTMILDNRTDEFSPDLKAKLDYVRCGFQEDIDQMLYYSRLKSSTKDYRFEYINLLFCVEEVLEDYAPLLQEKKFIIKNEIGQENVFTDRRGLQFILAQIISNAIKYSCESPVLTISLKHTLHKTILSIKDNGMGVKSYELPYIFQKGFTGNNTADRKKATGMGLYLALKMADDLGLKLETESEYNKYFEIRICFPVID